MKIKQYLKPPSRKIYSFGKCQTFKYGCFRIDILSQKTVASSTPFETNMPHLGSIDPHHHLSRFLENPAWWGRKVRNCVWMFFVKEIEWSLSHESKHSTRISLPNYLRDTNKNVDLELRWSSGYFVPMTWIYAIFYLTTKPLKTQPVLCTLRILAIQGHQHRLGCSKTSGGRSWLGRICHPTRFSTRDPWASYTSEN